MRKAYFLFVLFFALFFSEKNASAVTYRYPVAFTSFTGGMNYCDNRAAQPLSFTFSTTTCGAGGAANVNITVTWYSNTINSNSGGTPVQTVNSTAGTTTFIYVPPTTPVGTLYYYATVSWAAIGCVIAGSITTATTQQITVNSCPSSADMPDPPTNLITVPAGAYVIPMDNSHQNLWLTYPFNIKAYGLVDSLLLDDIPVYWVIKSGKVKDSSDFSAVASRVYPSTSAAALQYFKASEFIIDTAYLNRPHYAGEKSAIQIMNSFANRWKVAVYKLSSNTTVDVRYTLHQRPKLACFNNGTNQVIATKLLDSAKMSNFVAISAGVFTGLADCYTFCTEMHWSTATLADSPTMAPVWQFIQEGGNFFGQCAGENTYENLMQTPRHFHTTNGTVQHFPGTLPTNYYTNADMAFAQFQGSVVPRGGTTSDWTLAAGSVFDTETYNVMYSVSRDTIVAAARHYGSPDSIGGNVFFLGGHDYMTNTFTNTNTDSVSAIRYINGTRMFLNACLIPAHRPTAFVLDPGANQTICTGDSVRLGGSPTGPAGSTYSWSPAAGLSSTTSANPMASPTVTTTYTVIAFDGSCQGGPDVVTVTVNPKPAAPTASSNSPICSGTTLNLSTPTVAGATYSWTGPNGFVSSLQNPSISNATVAAAGTYSVTITVGGCTSAPGTVTVVVNPSPAMPTASSNSPICSGSTLTLSTPTVAGATYSWTGPNAFVSSLQNPTITNATVAASGTYSVTVTVGGCTSPVGTVTVTVNPTPATPTASSNSPICAGSTLNLSTPTVAGATYSWTGPNGFSSSAQNPLISNATVAASGTYSVTVTVGGCTSAAGTVVVTVSPIPATPTAGSNSPLCAGSTLTLTTPTVAGATYSWTGPNAFVSSLQNPTISNVTVADAGTYSVTVTVGGCSSLAGTVTVVINPTPATPTASSNSPVCAGSTLTLSTPTVAGATYSWTGPNAFVSALQNPSRTNVVLADAGTYSVTVTVGGCTSAVGTVTVVINPTPATPTASSNSPICAGSTLNLSTPTVAGATYSWTGPNGFSSGLQNPSITNATVAASGTYSVTVTVGGCTSAAGTVNVIVNPIPSTPTASSNSPVCAGTTLSLTTPTVAGATYSWTGPNGFSSGLQNPTISNVTLAAAGTYSVTVTVAGCASADGTVTVVVNPTPATPTASSNSPVCSGNTINLSTPTVAGATYSWTGPNAFSSSAQNPSIPNAVLADAGTYSVTVTVGGCTSAAGTVTVVVNPTPATPTPSSNSPVCAGSTLNLFTPTVAGATYSWTGPNSFSSSAQNPSIPAVTLAAAGTYSVTVTVGGCTSPVGTVTVVIGTTPATPTASSNSPICAGTTLNLTTAFVAGATYSWTGPNSFVSSLQNPSISNATLAAAGTYSLTITVGGCTSAVGTVTVVVNPSPATPTAGSNSPLCKGSTLSLTTPTVAGATYNWTGPNGFSSGLQNPTIPNVQPVNGGTYTITVTVAGCTSQPGLVTVVVDSPAVVNAGSNLTLCANNDSVHLNGTSSTGQGQWSTSGTGTFSPNNLTLNATYIPSNADTTAGSVTLTLTSRNNGACAAVANSITITFSHAPKAEAGNNVTVCANNAAVNLNGTVSIASGGIWSTSGTGTFSPNNTTLNATYNPSNADTTAGNVLLILTTTGNGGCKAVTDSMTITFTHAPNVNAGNNDTVCANNPNIALNGTSSTGSGTWSTSGTGTFTPNNNTLNATYNASPADTAAGSVTLTLTSTSNGTCLPVSKTIVLTITHSPSVNPGANVTVCANNDSVQLNGISTTGSGHWTTSGTGTFSPNSNTLNAIYVPSNADTTAGSVTLTLTSTSNGRCLAASRQMTITFTHAPTAEAGNNASACSNNGVITLNGSFTIAGGGIWSTSGSGTFSPNNTAMNATYTPSAADTTAGSVLIILTTTGNGGCKAVTDSLTITYTNAPEVKAGTDTTLCLNSPNYTLNGISSTGSGTWTTLGSGVFIPNNNTLNATYQPSNADTTAKIVTLILTSTNNGGCNPVSDTVVLRYTDVPVVNAGVNQTVCANNATVSLNATSSTNTGTWTTSGTGTFSPNNTTLNATYNCSAADTAAGTVTLTFTSTGGCIPVSQSITITITDAPNVEAGPNQSVCKNAASLDVNLNGTVGGGATTGAWTTSGSGTFSPNNTTLNATYSPSSADTAAGSVMLILTSTNNGNCLPVSDTMFIQYTKPPVTEAGVNDTGCANNSIPLNGTVTGGGGTGIWTTPNGSGSFVPNNTTLNASYVPSNADTAVGNVILILTSTNNGGCLASVDSVIITVLPGPVVEAGPDQNICKNNDNVSLAGTIKNAAGGIWSTSGSGTFNPNNTTLNATYVPSSADTTAGSVTLILTSTGNGLCTAVTDSMTVIFTPSPKVNAGNNIFICTGTTTANLNGIVWDGSTTGKWTTLGTGTFSPNDSTLNATYNLSSADTAAKTVTLILTSTNNGGCLPVTDTVTVKITPIPSVEAGNDTMACKNNANVTLNGLITGGSGTGVWTTSGTGTFTPNDSTLNATYNSSSADTAAGSVTLILTATNACMLVSDTVTITYTPAPKVNPGNNANICAGEIVNLGGTVSVATGGKWTTSGNGTFMPNDSALNATYVPGSMDTAMGTVTLYLTSIGNGGCLPVKDSIVITIQSKPAANFKSTPACLNSVINFTDLSTNSRGAISNWFWNFGNGTSTIQNPSNTYNTVGLQTVTLAVSTSAGCNDTIMKQIYVNPNPTANYISSTYCSDSAMFTDKSIVSPGTIKSWLWSFGDSAKSNLQDPNHTYLNPGTYTVTLVVMSDSGCSAAYLDTVTVKNCQNEISPPAIPTAFTPNGDGNNDVLLIRGGPFTQLDFRVFTEWGTQVFRSTTQTEGWDGKYKGKAQPEGTYTWTLVGTTADGKNYKMTGNVTILR